MAKVCLCSLQEMAGCEIPRMTCVNWSDQRYQSRSSRDWDLASSRQIPHRVAVGSHRSISYSPSMVGRYHHNHSDLCIALPKLIESQKLEWCRITALLYYKLITKVYCGKRMPALRKHDICWKETQDNNDITKDASLRVVTETTRLKWANHQCWKCIIA